MLTLIGKWIVRCFMAFVTVVRGRSRARVVAAGIAEALTPVVAVSTQHGSISFYCRGETPLWRAEKLLTKEPDTIEWLDSFDTGDLLWDVGANVGSYSLYAGRRGCRAVAFEPASANYALLVHNIGLNGLGDRVRGVCAAIHDRTKVDTFFMRDNEPGIALSSFEQARDEHGDTFAAGHREFVLGFGMDDLVSNLQLEIPDHVKVDVDGNEALVINGGQQVLADKRVKSLLIELDISRRDYCMAVADSLKKCGLLCAVLNDPDQFEWTPYLKTRNFIFRRAAG